MLNKLWDFLVRFRTWLVGTIGIVLVSLPDLIWLASELTNSPELVGVIPDQWRTYAAIASVALTVWTRPRPASRAADPEVKVKKAIKQTPGDTTVVVSQSGGEVTAVVRA